MIRAPFCCDMHKIRSHNEPCQHCLITRRNKRVSKPFYQEAVLQKALFLICTGFETADRYMDALLGSSLFSPLLDLCAELVYQIGSKLIFFVLRQLLDDGFCHRCGHTV